MTPRPMHPSADPETGYGMLYELPPADGMRPIFPSDYDLRDTAAYCSVFGCDKISAWMDQEGESGEETYCHLHRHAAPRLRPDPVICDCEELPEDILCGLCEEEEERYAATCPPEVRVIKLAPNPWEAGLRSPFGLVASAATTGEAAIEYATEPLPSRLRGCGHEALHGGPVMTWSNVAPAIVGAAARGWWDDEAPAWLNVGCILEARDGQDRSPAAACTEAP